MASKCVRSGCRLTNRSELELYLTQGKIERKHGFMLVRSDTCIIRLSEHFYQTTVTHAPPSKKDPRLAPLPRSGKIPYCACFRKYMEDRGVQSWAPGHLDDYVS
jgi:hypothetical protein